VEPHDAAQWASAYKIEVEVDGEEKEYLLKVIQRPRHAEMALGEYESQRALQQHLPDNVCIPLAHGTFELDRNTSFFMTPFRHLTDRIPSPAQFVDVFQKLHSSSVSPTGKYGFHVATFNGWVPIINDWCDTWEEYFTRQFRSDILWQQSIRGPDADFNRVAGEFFEKVIPRLLRPLETGGRSIRPVLLHGDVYEGNVKIDEETKQLILYDSCCCYGHNERQCTSLPAGAMRKLTVRT
jgi:protein-ribulosamine 3-kinase